MLARQHIASLVIAGGMVLGTAAAQAGADTIAYWRFEPGSLTVDSSSNGHTLTAHGGVASSSDTPGVGTGSASFDGVDDGFRTASTLDLTGATDLTIEFFMKPNGTATTDIVVEHSGNFTSHPGAFIISIENNDDLFGTQRVSGGYYQDKKQDGVVANTWTHYAMTIDGSATGASHLKLFINYQQTGHESIPNTALPTLVNEVFYIGARAVDNQFIAQKYPYGGLIDELRISDEVLEPSEFLAIPEPASLGLLGAGAVLVLGRRR